LFLTCVVVCSERNLQLIKERQEKTRQRVLASKQNMESQLEQLARKQSEQDKISAARQEQQKRLVCEVCQKSLNPAINQ
jgi:gluconate kinase